MSASVLVPDVTMACKSFAQQLMVAGEGERGRREGEERERERERRV